MEKQILGISIVSEIDGKREPYFVGNFVEELFQFPLNTIIENIDIIEDESDKLNTVIFSFYNNTDLEFSILKNQISIWTTDDSDTYDKFKKASELNSEEYLDELERENEELEAQKNKQKKNSLKPNGI